MSGDNGTSRATREDLLRAFASAESAEERVRLLAEGLRHVEALVRQTSAIRLGCLGPAAAPCLEMLRGVAAADASAPVKAWAGFALARVGDLDGGMGVLMGLLRHERVEVRAHAAIALSALGPDIPEAAVPDLVGALGDPSESVRWAVIWALGELGPSAGSARGALEALRADPSPPVRLAVSASLRKIRAPRPTRKSGS